MYIKTFILYLYIVGEFNQCSMIKCIVFIVFCYLATAVKGGLICRQVTDGVVPKNVDAKAYGLAGIECIHEQCSRYVRDVYAIVDGQISNLYDEAIQTGNATNLLKRVNTLEISTSIKVTDNRLECMIIKEDLINHVAARIEESTSANDLDQAERLRQLIVTADNNIYVSNSQFIGGRLTTQAATAFELARLIDCTDCGSVTRVIQRVRSTSRFVLHSLIEETFDQIRVSNQDVIDELQK